MAVTGGGGWGGGGYRGGGYRGGGHVGSFGGGHAGGFGGGHGGGFGGGHGVAAARRMAAAVIAEPSASGGQPKALAEPE